MQLTSTFAQNGKVEWIGVRPERRENVKILNQVDLHLTGLVGDHYANPGKRSVTLIQKEHLPTIAMLAGRKVIKPELLRRNLVISGINLLGLKNMRFQIGTAILEGTGICAPCSRMEETLGTGGYNAVRGHGGITAKVIDPGTICTGDSVVPIQACD